MVTNTKNLSYFRMLRRTNPDQYHQLDTYRDMFLWQKKLGSQFFDLMQEHPR